MEDISLQTSTSPGQKIEKSIQERQLDGLQKMGLITSICIYIGTRFDLLNTFLESYGAPGAEGYIGYYFMRAIFQTNPKISAAAAITLNAIFEIDQFMHPIVTSEFGHNLATPIVRTPDMRDIAAGVVGAGVAYGVERIKINRRKSTFQQDDPPEESVPDDENELDRDNR